MTAGRWRSALRRRPRHVGEEVWRFLLVGGAGFVVDVGVFTLLRTSALGLLEDRPLTAKVVSTVVATAVTWLGNRWWTWGHRTTGSTRRELLLFLAVNAGGTGIALACLAVSHYLLGLTSVLADNVSANGVGLVLGTAFRFVAYRALVFRDVPGHRPPPVPPSEALLVPGPHRTGPGRSGAEPGSAA
ncbi:GtrA family protein [Pseudokineococcus sp. 5B2Z-1]|uniref:GtrA family protein n=1 Tax=Pseudokineococcus sp. 5B2Z-1 TaxID=3132744 RepID=UPI00309488F2